MLQVHNFIWNISNFQNFVWKNKSLTIWTRCFECYELEMVFEMVDSNVFFPFRFQLDNRYQHGNVVDRENERAWEIHLLFSRLVWALKNYLFHLHHVKRKVCFQIRKIPPFHLKVFKNFTSGIPVLFLASFRFDYSYGFIRGLRRHWWSFPKTNCIRWGKTYVTFLWFCKSNPFFQNIHNKHIW